LLTIAARILGGGKKDRLSRGKRNLGAGKKGLYTATVKVLSGGKRTASHLVKGTRCRHKNARCYSKSTELKQNRDLSV
jgi:hypothetical protein